MRATDAYAVAPYGGVALAVPPVPVQTAVSLGEPFSASWTNNSVFAVESPADIVITQGNGDTGSIVYNGSALPIDGTFRCPVFWTNSVASFSTYIGVVGPSGSTQANPSLESTFYGVKIGSSGGFIPIFAGVAGTAYQGGASLATLTGGIITVQGDTVFDFRLSFAVNGTTLTMSLWLVGYTPTPLLVATFTGTAPAFSTVLPMTGNVNGGSFAATFIMFGGPLTPTWDGGFANYPITHFKTFPGNARCLFQWDQIPNANSYDYRIDGGSTVNVVQQAALSQSLTVTGLSNAAHTIEIRPVNVNGVGAWQLYSFTTSASNYLLDDFVRADSTTLLGSPVQGGPYTAATGVWGILTNQPYTPSSTVRALATAPAAADFDMRFVLTQNGGSNGYGVVFRYSDSSNYWRIQNNNETLQVIRRVAGADTTMWSWSSYMLTVQDRAAEFRLIAVGKAFWLYLNGLELLYFESGFNLTATVVGLYNSQYNLGVVSAMSVNPPPSDPSLGRASVSASLLALETATAAQPPAQAWAFLGGVTKTDDPVGFA